MTCLGNENWSNAKLSFNIQGMVDTLKACYTIYEDNSSSRKTIIILVGTLMLMEVALDLQKELAMEEF